MSNAGIGQKGWAPGAASGAPGLRLAEDALDRIHRAGLATLALYYIGSLPFVLGLITFWASMRQSAYAYQTLPEGALGLAVLFVWMKTWQSRFCQCLLAQLRDEAPPPWGLRHFFRSASIQGAFQATGFVVLPLAVLITIPFGWVHAAYQNATVLDDGKYRSVRALLEDATRHARLWPQQNHVIIWLLSPFLLLMVAGFFLGLLPVIQGASPEYVAQLGEALGVLLILALMPLSPFGVVIAINIAMGILTISALLHTFLGIETVLGNAPFTIFNSTFTAVVCGLAYLCMDPVLKAAYVLRCFHGDALETGQDLRLALRKAAGRAVPLCLLLAVLAGAASAAADSSTGVGIDAGQLDRALDRELQRARYTWRMPRERLAAQEKGIIGRTLSKISESINNAFTYLRKTLKEWLEPKLDRHERSWGDLRAIALRLRLLLIGLLVVLLVVLALLLVRLWRRRRHLEALPKEIFAAVAPDIEDEVTSADELPEEGWLTMARELMDSGQYRLAIRALFLATLARLAHYGLIQIAWFKSNQDYAHELGRRMHVHTEALPLFSQSAGIYEAVWYGDHDASPATLRDTLLDNLRALGDDAQA